MPKAVLLATALLTSSSLFAAKPKELRTEITITTTPDKVWAILMNFNNYPNWNPFIKSIKGEAIKGKKLTAHIVPPGTKGMTFKPRVLTVNTNNQLRWKGRLLLPGLFDGEHFFEIIDNGNGTVTFIQREQFRGIFVPLFKNKLDKNTKAGFEQMNAKLKELAEKEG